MPRLPQSDEARWVARVCHRRLTTPWDTKEIRRFRFLLKDGFFKNKEDLTAIERYTEHERKKGERGFYRRDLYTFLNNIHAELDRALDWQQRHPPKPPIRKVIPLPLSQSDLPIEDVNPDTLARFQRDLEAWKQRNNSV